MTEEKKYWDEEIETMPLERLKKLQEERFISLVNRAYEKTKLYRRKFDGAGIKPSDIQGLDDLQKLPLTTYTDDFCKSSPLEKLAIPMDEVVTINSTSGTLSGYTQPILLSKKDWDFYIYGEARSRWTIGVRPKDVVQCLTPFESSSRGYQAIGTTMLLSTAGRGNPDHQIKLAKEMGVTVMEYLPSLVLNYFDRASQLGIDIRETKLRLVVGGGECFADAYRERIEAEYGIPFRTLYGSAEAGGIGLECEVGDGLHFFADCGIIEVIDIDTEEVLPAGEEGQIVYTPLWNEAVPLIRYKVGDVGTVLPYKPCACGRTHPKLSLIKGRVAHMVRVQGKRVFPIDLEEIIAKIPDLGSENQIIVDTPGELEKLKVKAEYRPEVKEVSRLKNRLEEAIYEELGVKSEVELVPAGTLGRVIFKAQRLIKTYE
ncbi:MAG: AMP-binding protein [Thermodesulfobacteriota bacterium]|nr:AMP-binding protein [Thermodesulfobacteriota bacterium]